jgi:ketosteroid isomerase-like protein
VQLITPLSPNTAKALPPQRIPALAVTPQPALAAKPAPAPALAPAPAPVLAKVEPPKPAPAPVPAKVEPAKPAPVPAKVEPLKQAPAPVLAKVEPPKPAPKVEPVKPDNSESDAVLKQVHGWAKAWSAQNVDGYLGYYANEFEPPKGMSRKAWADERRARIAGKGRIHVDVGAPEVDVHGNTAKVTFRQTYESDRLTARSRKTLVLIKNGGKWQIKQESSGS